MQNAGLEKTWTRDGKISGTTGKGLRLEGIQIRLYGAMRKRYDVWYRVHAQNIGWMAWAKNGQKAGTQGLGCRAEALQVVLVKKGDKAPTKTYKGTIQSTTRVFANGKRG